MKRKSLLALMALILGLSGQQALAQSTMMNAPSTDVVAAKKVYLEMDFITNYAWAQGDDRFANYLPRAVVGVGRNVEVGVNVSYTRVPGGGAPIEIHRTRSGSSTKRRKGHRGCGRLHVHRADH